MDGNIPPPRRRCGWGLGKEVRRTFSYKDRDFPSGPVVTTLILRRGQAPSLVRSQSHMLRGELKKKKKQNKTLGKMGVIKTGTE